MKSGILLFILLSTPYFLIAQWQSLGSNNTPNEKNNGIMGVFAPSEDVIWGTVWNRQDFSPSHVFIKSVDGGTTVTSGSINTEDATLAPLGIFALDENTAWIGMASEPCQCYGQVYKTTDGGDTWTKQFSTDSNQSLGGIYFWDEHEGFVFGSDGTGNLSDKYVVYHTTDGGATWNETSPTQLETGEGMWIGSVNGIFEVIGDNIWFGSRKGRVFKSSDRGITWKVSETFAPGRTINAIAFKDEWNGIALSTINASNKAWKTVDGGMSWTEIGIPPNPSAYSIQYIPETPNTYVVSGGWDSPNMLITTNGGSNWKTLSTPPLIGTYFLSPTTGYGGGDILDDNKGGLYKFISSLDSSHINVVTLAGSSMEGVRTGNGESAKFWNPKGMTMDEEGNLYVAGDYSLQIHKITPAGEVSIVAGSGGYGYEDGPAEEAQFARPHGVVLDDEGNLFVADFFNAVIRKITPEGIVSTWAGTGEQGGQDGAAGTATFGRLSDIVKDVYGNFYVADNNKIRKINNEGIVSTLAGSDEPGFMDGMGADARFYFIWGLGIDTDGNIYAADFFNHAIRKITPQGEVTTVAGTGNPGYLDGAGTIAKFSAPEDVAVDGQGNIYVADGQNFRVRKIAPDGMVSTVCGIGDPSYFYLDGGQPLIDGEGDFAQFGRLRSILVKPDGNLLVSSWSNDAIREIQIGMPSNALQVIELGSDKPYRFTPIEHQNNFQFSSTVFNMSIEIIDGVQMKVSVLQEDNILYEESSTPVSVEDFGEQVLWLESEGFTAIETGTYDVKYEFSTEDEGIFTTRYDELIVTDSILSGSDYHFYYTVGYQDFNPDWRGKYGQEYTIIQPDTLTGISNFFRADSATTVHFSIYGMNGGLPTDQPIYISGPITFDSTFNGWHYHHLPEAIILDQGAYVFAMEHNTSPGFLSLRWDTDFQTTGVWSDIPEVTDGWEPYQSLFNVSKICGTMITPVFGQKEVITNTSQPILPAWTVDVHPNPFVNQISVSINAAHTMYFQLLDTKGQVLQTFESKGKTTIDKDLSDLPSGTYFLSVSDGEGLTVKRMVKR